jgi:hypothetical protein
LTASILTGFANSGGSVLPARRLPNFIIEPAYFHLRFNRRTELHVPIKMNTEAEFFAAMIAADIRSWAQTVVLGR